MSANVQPWSSLLTLIIVLHISKASIHGLVAKVIQVLLFYSSAKFLIRWLCGQSHTSLEFIWHPLRIRILETQLAVRHNTLATRFMGL